MSGVMSFVRRETVWVLLLAVAAYSALKGVVMRPQLWGEVNWFATYEHGFMRRGLAGTVFHGLFGGMKPGVYQLGIVYQHHLAVALLVLIVVIGLRFAARRSRDYFAMAMAGLVVCASQALPHLSYDVGYLDPHILLLLAIGVFGLALRWVWLAAIMAAIGPLVHEQFVFYWLPIVAAHLVINIGLDRQSPMKAVFAGLAVAVPAIITVALVVVLQNGESVRLAIAATTLTAEAKQQMAAQTFDLSMGSVLAYMGYLWTTYGVTGVVSLIAYAFVPGLLLCWIATRAFSSLGHSSVIWAALLVGTFGCLTILVVAWDLSRFASLPVLVWVAVVTLIASRAPREPAAVAEGESTPKSGGVLSKALAAAAIIIGLISPFVFAYFNSIYIVRGPFQFVGSPVEGPVKDLLHAQVVRP